MTTPTAQAVKSIRVSLRAALVVILADDEDGRMARAQLGRALIEELENAYSLLKGVEQRLSDPENGRSYAREIIHNVRSDEVLDARIFAAAVRDEYGDSFARHRRIAELLERAVATARTLQSPLAVALDILMRQAYVAHASVRTLAELGHTEDGATLARRILELAVRAAYLAAEGKPLEERVTRVNDFLGRLWRRLPPELQATIPDYSRAPWDAADTAIGTAKGRRVQWSSMFADIGHGELYDSDYAELSSIAHGSPFAAPLHYASDIVPLRDIRLVNAVLNAANRYYLATALVWNAEVQIVDDTELQGLVAAEVALHKRETETDGDSP